MTPTKNPQAEAPVQAFSLIEMIAVLTVLTILATIILAATIKQMDRVASDAEYAQLRVLAQTFIGSALRNRYIPAPTNWIQMVAQETGVDQTTLSLTARRTPRALLVDPALQVGVNGGGLPYRQSNSGSVVTNAAGAIIPPVNPRLMILSSIGPLLPAGVTNGSITTNDFSAIWDTADGTVPAGTPWAGWKGTGTDLKVQRINFKPQFLQLILENNYSDTQGYYSIDRAATNAVSTVNGVNAYYLQGSLVSLYRTPTTPDSEQIMASDSHYVFTLGIWRGSIYDGPTISAPLFSLVAGQFLASPWNYHAGQVDLTYPNRPKQVSTQYMLVYLYTNFMQLYINWANIGFPTGPAYDSTYKNPLTTLSSEMNSAADNLDNGIQQGQYTNAPALQ